MELDFKKKIIIGLFFTVIILISIYLYYDYVNNNSNDIITENNIEKEDERKTNDLEKTINNEIKSKDENIIIVHIAGAVVNPGIVKVKEGARLYEGIEVAGGSLNDADLSRVNLAYTLSDGQKIYIPKIGEVITGQSEFSEYISSGIGNNDLLDSESGSLSGGDKVNINTANQTELETLPGIGPSTAQKIIEYRNKNGKFETIEDIQNVKGIGDGKFDDIKDNIFV